MLNENVMNAVAPILERLNKAVELAVYAAVEAALATQSTELEQLRAENARLKAPVSDDEWKCYGNRAVLRGYITADEFMYRSDVDELIQSRLAAPKTEEPHADAKH